MDSSTIIQDLSALITLLITEIRTTLNAKIDTLNEKLEIKDETIRKLKETVAAQECTIAKLQQEKQAFMTQVHRPTTPTALTTVTNRIIPTNFNQPQQPSIPKQRGIKAYNLLFTCDEIDEDDPKRFVENILITKFNRKPLITAVTVVNPKENKLQQPEGNNIQSTSTSNNDRTPTKNEPIKILVTFNSIWDVRALYKDRVRALKNTNMYISEDLTKNESSLFYKARMLKRNNAIHSTWTEEGDTYIKENQESPPTLLNDSLLTKLEKNKTMKKDSAQKLEKEPTTTSSDTTFNKRNKETETFERITRKKNNNIKIQ